MTEQPVAYYHGCNYNSLTQLQTSNKMHGAKRVIVFCCLTAILPTIVLIIPLYLRHKVFMDRHLEVSESDIKEVKEGISSIFCQAQTLKMNSTFSAFQVRGEPKYSAKRKHIRLKKSMTLPDDTLEYWGFFLPQGSTVNLSVCSRYEGGSLLVVKDGKHLRTCGLLEHNKRKSNKEFEQNGEVKITFETAAEVINNQHSDFENHGGETEEIEDPELLKHSAKQFIDKKLNEKIKRDIGRYGVAHGNTKDDNDSTSSFEEGLRFCYEGSIKLLHKFPYSSNCTGVDFLNSVTHMSTKHEVQQDGYYYYIFFSDNDLVSNDLHAVFNIYKPTLLQSNHTGSTRCINKTECSFGINFYDGHEYSVFVEVPTRDGLEHEPDDVTTLISSCEPRMYVYLIFPFIILFCVMACAFI